MSNAWFHIYVYNVYLSCLPKQILVVNILCKKFDLNRDNLALKAWSINLFLQDWLRSKIPKVTLVHEDVGGV